MGGDDHLDDTFYPTIRDLNEAIVEFNAAMQELGHEPPVIEKLQFLGGWTVADALAEIKQRERLFERFRDTVPPDAADEAQAAEQHLAQAFEETIAIFESGLE